MSKSIIRVLLEEKKFKISLGDARSYFVTTARNDLGVIFATSEAGNYSKLILRDILRFCRCNT